MGATGVGRTQETQSKPEGLRTVAFQANDGCPSPLLTDAKWVSEKLGRWPDSPMCRSQLCPSGVHEPEAVP